MNEEDTSKEIMSLFSKCLKKLETACHFNVHSPSVNVTAKKQRGNLSILPAIWKAFGISFMFGFSLKVMQDLIYFVPPQVLRLIIKFVDSSKLTTAADRTSIMYEPEPLWHGIFYALLLFVAICLRTVLFSQYSQRMSMIGLRIRTALTGAIYKKALILSNSARKESTIGEIVNLISTDSHQFLNVPKYVSQMFSAIMQICLALYFLWDLMGASVLAGEFTENFEVIRI